MHTAPRLFLPAPLQEGAALVGTTEQAHHLGTVLRRAQGDTIRLFNGRDGEFTARITQLRRNQLALEVGTRLRLQADEPDLWLVFAVLKRDATDLVVEKATELGAACLVPVFTERTNAARVNLDRLRAIATEAAVQCERLTVPEVREPRRLTDLLGSWHAPRCLYSAVERATAPALGPWEAGTQSALLIGPEGGFTQGELDVLRSAPFIQPVSLGSRVLRAETAAIAGLAQMLAWPRN